MALKMDGKEQRETITISALTDEEFVGKDEKGKEERLRKVKTKNRPRTPPPTTLPPAAGAQALVTGRVSRDPSGRLKAEFRLWDVESGQQLTGQQYVTDANFWRRVGHIISDAVYTKVTGFGGFFDTRIVFVDESGPKENRRKRLAIMDQDGANVRFLTQGDNLVVTPRYSPAAQSSLKRPCCSKTRPCGKPGRLVQRH